MTLRHAQSLRVPSSNLVNSAVLPDQHALSVRQVRENGDEYSHRFRRVHNLKKAAALDQEPGLQLVLTTGYIPVDHRAFGSGEITPSLLAPRRTSTTRPTWLKKLSRSSSVARNGRFRT